MGFLNSKFNPDWVNSFVEKVVSPLGYFTYNLDIDYLQHNFVIPPYIDRVCLIINDGDNLALNREQRKDGVTEKIMSLLDGNQINCITPFTNTNNTKLIVFITANTIDRWDAAALRKGRIDHHYKFNEKAYKD